MNDAIKALKEVAAVSRPGGPIHQAAAAGIRALDDERAGREQAEWERDRAIVAGAVLLRAAREALADIADNVFHRGEYEAKRSGLPRCTLTKSSGDVADDEQMVCSCDWTNRALSRLAVAVQPALPDPTEALAAFARSVVEACAVTAENEVAAVPLGEAIHGGPLDDAPRHGVLTATARWLRALDPADIVKRWLGGEGR